MQDKKEIPQKLRKEIAECFADTNEARCFKCHKFRLAEKKWGLQLTYNVCKQIFEQENKK